MAHQGSCVDLQPELVKLPHVGEEETQEGQGCEPLTHSADHMCCVALKQGRTSSSFPSCAVSVRICVHSHRGCCLRVFVDGVCVSALWLTFYELTYIYSAFHF